MGNAKRHPREYGCQRSRSQRRFYPPALWSTTKAHANLNIASKQSVLFTSGENQLVRICRFVLLGGCLVGPAFWNITVQAQGSDQDSAHPQGISPASTFGSAISGTVL